MSRNFELLQQMEPQEGVFSGLLVPAAARTWSVRRR